MGIDVILVVLSLGFILLASMVFTNGVELLGFRLGMHQGIVGSILAAVGTALPETVIPIIAILFHRDAAAHAVGVGAIAGAPFMLATLGFFVTGAAVLAFASFGKRSFQMRVDAAVTSRDLTFFVAIYGVAVLTTFVHNWPLAKQIVAVFLLLGYVWYVRKTVASDSHQVENIEPLHFARLLRMKESLPLIVVQIAASLVLMVWGAHMFVLNLTGIATAMGVSALLLSIIITPIATELPEKCNSILWVGKSKDVLALGNITGAMVFQSSFPVVFGIVFTHWDLRGLPLASAILAFASALLVLIWVKVRKSLNPWILMTGGLLYGVFIAYVVGRPAGP